MPRVGYQLGWPSINIYSYKSIWYILGRRSLHSTCSCPQISLTKKTTYKIYISFFVVI